MTDTNPGLTMAQEARAWLDMSNEVYANILNGRMRASDVKPAPDYADQIAERLYRPGDRGRLVRDLLAQAAREGYALGYAAGGAS
jgi:hypothetical protein